MGARGRPRVPHRPGGRKRGPATRAPPAADAGRDPAAIELTAAHPGLFRDDPVAAAQELADLGVSRTIVPGFLLAGAPAEKAEQLAETIIRPCADVG